MFRRDADCSEVLSPMTITNTQVLAYSSHDLEAWTNGRYGRRGSTVPGNQWSMAAGIMTMPKHALRVATPKCTNITEGLTL